MTQAPSFGVLLAGVPVLLPAGIALEFVAQASLYPLPMAPERVVGLMQLRGQPLLVLDASVQRAERHTERRTGTSRDVLVVGTLPQAAALLVDGPPRRVEVTQQRDELADTPRGALAECPFVDALTSHRVDRADAHAGWYEVDPERLFEALMRS